MRVDSIVKEIRQEIRGHELELKKLHKLLEAAESFTATATAISNGTQPHVKTMGLEKAIIDVISEKDSLQPGVTFHSHILYAWLGRPTSWKFSSITGSLSRLERAGIIENVGMSAPYKDDDMAIAKRQRIFKVV